MLEIPVMGPQGDLVRWMVRSTLVNTDLVIPMPAGVKPPRVQASDVPDSELAEPARKAEIT